MLNDGQVSQLGFQVAVEVVAGWLRKEGKKRGVCVAWQGWVETEAVILRFTSPDVDPERGRRPETNEQLEKEWMVALDGPCYFCICSECKRQNVSWMPSIYVAHMGQQSELAHYCVVANTGRGRWRKREERRRKKHHHTSWYKNSFSLRIILISRFLPVQLLWWTILSP